MVKVMVKLARKTRRQTLKERAILIARNLYEVDGLLLWEIGIILNRSESRISQMLKVEDKKKNKQKNDKRTS